MLPLITEVHRPSSPLASLSTYEDIIPIEQERVLELPPARQRTQRRSVPPQSEQVGQLPLTQERRLSPNEL